MKVKKKPVGTQKGRRNFIPDGLVQYLGEHLPGFAKLSLRRQVNLARMITQTPLAFRGHKLIDGYASYSARELERAFGRGGFERINKQFDAFTVTEEWCYYEDEAFTKGYKLTPEMAQLRAGYFNNRKRPPSNLRCEAGHIRRTTPRNALTAKVNVGGHKKATRPTWKGAPVRSAVPVNVPRLEQLADFVASELDALARNQRSESEVNAVFAQSTLDSTLAVLDAANNTLAPGHLLHQYEMSGSGRLFARGVTLQSCHRQVRYAAMDGMFDYDIENCHINIFSQTAWKLAGFESNAIAHYLANKKAIRQNLATDLELSLAQVKKVLLALTYGATFSHKEDAGIPQIVGGIAKANEVYRHPTVRELREDVNAATSAILEGFRNDRGRLPVHISNACGLRVRRAKKRPSQLMSHLLQGVESQALEVMHELYSDHILLLQHDGFTADRGDLDLDVMQNAIHAKTGYHLRISCERIEVAFQAAVQNLDRKYEPIQTKLQPSIGVGLG